MAAFEPKIQQKRKHADMAIEVYTNVFVVDGGILNVHFQQFDDQITRSMRKTINYYCTDFGMFESRDYKKWKKEITTQ